MFERFTNKARLVLSLAQTEAKALRHNFIGTEHITLGVLGVNDEVVTQALAGFDFTVADIRESVAMVVGPGEEEPAGSPPFTPRAKKTLEYSLREALGMGHQDIGPAHILLGVLREGEGVGAQALAEKGVEYDSVRLWVAQLLGEGERVRRRGKRFRARDVGAWMPGLTPAATRAFAAAAKEGQAGTHDLLLGVMAEPDSLGAKVLTELGVTKDALQAKIAEVGVEGTSDAPPKPPPPPRTVKLTEGVEVRITDAHLGELAETGQLQELISEILKRTKASGD